jgi:hypothetical protein
MAPSPVPVGCEKLPVMDGRLSEHRTNTTAPGTESSVSASHLSLMRIFSWYSP